MAVRNSLLAIWGCLLAIGLLLAASPVDAISGIGVYTSTASSIPGAPVSNIVIVANIVYSDTTITQLNVTTFTLDGVSYLGRGGTFSTTVTSGQTRFVAQFSNQPLGSYASTTFSIFVRYWIDTDVNGNVFLVTGTNVATILISGTYGSSASGSSSASFVAVTTTATATQTASTSLTNTETATQTSSSLTSSTTSETTSETLSTTSETSETASTTSFTPTTSSTSETETLTTSQTTETATYTETSTTSFTAVRFERMVGGVNHHRR